MEEIWKDIYSYEGLYRASNLGRIKSFKDNHNNYRERILKPGKQKNNYLFVILCKIGEHKQYRVHRLILETFVGSCPTGMESRHLDGNPSNNKLNNLKWDTHKNNENDKIKHGTYFQPNSKGSKNGRAIINENKALKIKQLIKEGKLTIIEIANICDATTHIVKSIKNNKTWKHIQQEV